MTRLLTTADVAEQLSVSEEWVRDHAGELGGVKLGSDRRAPWRFEQWGVDDYLARHRSAIAPRPRPRSRVTRRSEGVDLLPIPEGLL